MKALDNNIHRCLDELELVTDLHFCFTPESIKKIDPEKFSELYQAESYSINQDETGISGIMEAIRYDRAMYPGQHIQWFVVTLGLQGTSEVVKQISMSSDILTKSIFQIKRETPDQLYDQYTRTYRIWKGASDRIGTYTTHQAVSETGVIVLRPELIDLLVDYNKANPGYIETFLNFPDFLGSTSQRIPEALKTILMQDPKDVKVNTNR